MSSEIVPDPCFTSLAEDMLSEMEIGMRKPSERSSATEGLEPSGSIADDLSARERDVLRYLPTMLTTSEIAVELHVSVNTIKTHTRSIYRKLGASRRQVAVVRAYEYGILGPRSFVRPSADVEGNWHTGRGVASLPN
jgi:LuxR family maltose regulon positive regulatory protein